MDSLNTSIKLLIDKKRQRVLFAEASKEFVDFLFQIFSLPLGTLIEYLGSKQMVGCLGDLKESIDSFHGTYLQPNIEKDDIFNPKTVFNRDTFLLSYEASDATSKSFYRCSSLHNHEYSDSEDEDTDDDGCSKFVSENPGAKCPDCNSLMNDPLTVVGLPATVEKEAEGKKKVEGGGYVKEVVTYMVMDNLVVKPMSTISSISLIINSFGVKDLSLLEEKTFPVGKDEALKLLKASLMTDQVLTSLFRDADVH